ncbi:beta-amyrin 28-monooxygenase-like [Papaver somniferum]|uniref:beta-amyrin 28-monooxygenase-like n=1 Tax=Papaver somniferum TaxID=3469 RepID=UPI000E701240|nr:beta-amyrin 28-monooxygenase-like [Papaver somniferum]
MDDPLLKISVVLLFALIFLLSLYSLKFLQSILITTKQHEGTTVVEPPGTTGWPIIGETLDYGRANLKGFPEKFFYDRVRKYSSKVFKTSLIGETVTVLDGPAGNKFLFSNEYKLVTIWWPRAIQRIVPITDGITSPSGIQLMAAGYHTTSTVITVLMKFLADFPDVLNEVLQEQNEVAKSKSPGELLNLDDIYKMKYSWNVICEVPRLAPPFQGGFTEALTDFTYAGYFIPKGRKLYWTGISTHMNPENFPDPEKFDPSRFQGKGPAPYTFVPFGGGAGMCPGYEYARVEILVLLHHVVRRYKWEKLIPGNINERLKVNPYPLPPKGFPIRLQPRTT